MKKKNLDKIREIISVAIKDTYKEIKDEHQDNQKYSTKSQPQLDEDSVFKPSDYNEEVSSKFSKLVTNLLNYDSIEVQVLNNKLTLRAGSIKDIKLTIGNSNKTSTSGPKLVESDYLGIEIRKTSFNISRNYSEGSCFADNELYNHFLPLFIEKSKDLNISKFNNLFNSLMKESGLLRDSNLDELIK